MRFQCQPGCIRCCQQEGHVYVTAEDIARLAAHCGLSLAEFQRKYLCGRAPLLRLRKPRGKQCPFLTATGCSVHAIKPQQCRAFPYWPEILDSASERKQIAAYCPGMGRGPLVNLTVARREANRLQKSFPHLYDPGGEAG